MIWKPVKKKDSKQKNGSTKLKKKALCFCLTKKNDSKMNEDLKKKKHSFDFFLPY